MRSLRLLLLPMLLALLTFGNASAQGRADSGDDRPRVIFGDEDDDRRTRGRRADRRGGGRDDDDVRERGRRGRTQDARDRDDRDDRDGDWDDDDRDGDWDDDVYGRTGDVYGKRGGKSSAKRGGGPAFCRSGAGHPVHGREWCRDKGFGLGNDGYGSRVGDIILRRPDRTRRGGILSPGTLEDVLGRRLYQRFDDTRRSLGLSAPMEGRLLNTRDGRGHVLQLRSGRTPFGELLDLNGDGRVDDVRMRDRR